MTVLKKALKAVGRILLVCGIILGLIGVLSLWVISGIVYLKFLDGD